jgi:hypothetical protein
MSIPNTSCLQTHLTKMNETQNYTPNDLHNDQHMNNQTEQSNKQKSKKRKPLSNPTKGHKLYKNKDNQHVRFLYYNINSLRSKTTGKWKAILEQLEKYGIDITGLCETCTNWSNNKKRNLLKKY